MGKKGWCYRPIVEAQTGINILGSWRGVKLNIVIKKERKALLIEGDKTNPNGVKPFKRKSIVNTNIISIYLSVYIGTLSFVLCVFLPTLSSLSGLPTTAMYL